VRAGAAVNQKAGIEMTSSLRLCGYGLAGALVAGLLALPMSARAVGPDPSVPDPSAPGPDGFVHVQYDLPQKVVVGFGTPSQTPANTSTLLSMRLAGDISYPRHGRGPFPVIIFMHGNHETCSSAIGQQYGLLIEPGSAATYSDGKCTTGSATADSLFGIDESRSYLGYDYIEERMASQGYVVASMDINDITNWSNNANESGYMGRAEIMAKTFDLLRKWDHQTGPSGIGNALIGREDFSRVGVMGHSRGGEGVNLFAEYNASRPATAAAAAARTDPETPGRAEPVPDFGPRYPLRAVFSLAPVDGQGGRYPVIKGTNYAVLLPYCDGDVFDLEGAPVFERSKNGLADSGQMAVQYLINGANHDYFNTDWTDDDANLFGFGDPNCNVKQGPGRLSAADERQVGLTLIPAFLRDYVGGEHQFDPIVDGQALPPQACPTRYRGGRLGVNCDNVVQSSEAPPYRRLLIGPGKDELPSATPDGDPITYSGFRTASACTPDDSDTYVTTGCGSTPNRSLGPQMTVEWDVPATLSVALAGADQDLTRYGVLGFRSSENYTSPLQPPVADHVQVTLTDTSGVTRTVDSSAYSDALDPEPGTTARKQVLNGVRIPLTEFAPVDLAQVKTIALGFGSGTDLTGSIQFADLALGEVPGGGLH
jgi:hypothetical protein